MYLFEPLKHRSLVDDFGLLTLIVAGLEQKREIGSLIPILLVVRRFVDLEIGMKLLL